MLGSSSAVDVVIPDAIVSRLDSVSSIELGFPHEFLAEFPDSLMILDDVGEESTEEVGFQTIQVGPSNGSDPKERALTNILGKLGVSSRTEAATLAQRMGLI